MPRIQEYKTNQSGLNSGEILVARIDLECKLGNSDKVYILEIPQRKQSNGTVKFEVMAYYGKRGHLLQSKSYGVFSTVSDAIAKMYHIASDKQRIGRGNSRYTKVHEEDHTAPVMQTPQGRKTLDVSSYVIPADVRVTKEENMREFAIHDDYIFENVKTMQFKWFRLQNHAFEMYAVNGEFLDYIELKGKPQSHGLITFNGAVFLMVDDGSGYYQFMDVCYVPGHPKDIRLYMWKERCAVMNVIFDELWPGVDMYQGFDLYKRIDYRSYKYQKLNLLDNGPADSIIIAKHINHNYEDGTWHVFAK